VLYRDRLSYHPDDLATIVDAREALTRLLPARSPDVVKHLNNLGLSLLVNPDLASEPDGSARPRHSVVPAQSGSRQSQQRC
jgi:hypothetical protein